MSDIDSFWDFKRIWLIFDWSFIPVWGSWYSQSCKIVVWWVRTVRNWNIAPKTDFNLKCKNWLIDYNLSQWSVSPSASNGRVWIEHGKCLQLSWNLQVENTFEIKFLFRLFCLSEFANWNRQHRRCKYESWEEKGRIKNCRFENGVDL